MIESMQGVLRRISEGDERNGYDRSEAVSIIKASSRLFLADAVRFGYSDDHVKNVIATHTADIDMIESGEIISIVKYTHQGAYICD